MVRATIVAAAGDTTTAAPRRVTTAAKRGILRAIAVVRVSKEEEHHRPGIRVRERHTAAALTVARSAIFRRIVPSRRGTKPVINVDKMDTLRGIVRIPGKSELLSLWGRGTHVCFYSDDASTGNRRALSEF